MKTICRRSGYDLNTVEFAIKDGIPYAIDFMNPAPDAELASVGEYNHNWVVGELSDFLIKKLSSPADTTPHYRWDGMLNPPVELGHPRGDRRLAAGQDHPGVVVQRGHQVAAQPGVQQPEHLVRVEREEHPPGQLAERVRRLGDRPQRPAHGFGQRREESALGRLDGAAVDGHHGRPALPGVRGERAEQGGLADPGDAVDRDDERAVPFDQIEQGRPLPAPAADSVAGGEQGAQRTGHHMSLGRSNQT